MKKITVAFVSFIFLGLSACVTQDKTPPAYINNQVVAAKVRAVLIEDPDIKNNNISVNVHKGEVQLSGYVDSKAEVKKAGRLAESVPGVMKVKNNLIVAK